MWLGFLSGRDAICCLSLLLLHSAPTGFFTRVLTRVLTGISFLNKHSPLSFQLKPPLTIMEDLALNRNCWKHRISPASVLTSRKETRCSNNWPSQSNSGQTLDHLLEVIPWWHSPVKGSDFALSCSIDAFSNTYGVSSMHFVWDNMNEWRLWAVFLNQGFFSFFTLLPFWKLK